ncbi:transposase [Baaleninema simplex]|uniref:transposase n=1 Tax=Baaleninema simplex TaxID=2862350 RepID=UPI001FDEC455|nr:transposase [Baaleninema simplex]
MVYSYGEVGKQKIVRQKERRGRRINIMGVWEPDQKLEYGPIGCSFNAQRYIQFLDAQAKQASKRLFETGQFTVIVNDNASIHRASKAKERQSYWEKQGVHLKNVNLYERIRISASNSHVFAKLRCTQNKDY